MIENLENEQWLPIENYENYQVSNFGRVKSLNYNKTKQERILKQVNDKDGYKRITLCKYGKQKLFQVHRLVASAFIPNQNNLPQVNHIDEVKTNNHVLNLEWCDCKYNINYGTRKEKVSKALSGENCYLFGKFGKDCLNSKKIIQLTLGGDYIKKWDSMHDVTRELGYSHGNISECCRGKRKSANGYKWCYA